MDKAIILDRTFAILQDTRTNKASFFIIPEGIEGYYYHLDGIRYDVTAHLPAGRKRPNRKKVICLDTWPATKTGKIYIEKTVVMRMDYNLDEQQQ